MRWLALVVALLLASVTHESFACVARAAENPVLELETGGHSALVTGVQFLPDGKTLVSVSVDRTIRFWDVRTGQCRKVIRVSKGQGRDGALYSLAVHPDGTKIAVGGWGYARAGGYYSPVYVIEIASEKIAHVLDDEFNGTVFALAFSADGKTLASSSENQITLWDAATGKLRGKLKGHTSSVVALAFNPRRPNILASAGDDRTARIWDCGREKLLATLREHEKGVTYVSWTRDGSRLATGSYDERVGIWSAGGELEKKIKVSGKGIFQVHFTPDGSRVLATRAFGDANKDNAPAWLDLQRHKYTSPQIPSRTNDWIAVGAVSPDGSLAATSAGDNHEIHVWNTITLREVVRLTSRARGRWAAGWQGNSTIAWGEVRPEKVGTPAVLERAFSLTDLRWRLLDTMKATRATSRLGGVELRVSATNNRAEYRSDGPLASTTFPSFFSLQSGTLVREGKWAALGGDENVLLCDTATGRRLRTLTGHASEVRDLVASPDGKYLLGSGADQCCCVWPLEGEGKRLFAGVGIFTKIVPGGIQVTSLVPDGAAEKDGRLKSGDIITEVAEGTGPFVRVDNLKENEVANILRGGEGTSIRLRVRTGAADVTTKTLSRKRLPERERGGIGVIFKKHPDGLEVAKVLPKQPATGYLRVGDVVTAAAQENEGFIRFSGQYTDAAIASVLGPAGTSVQLRYRRGKETEERSTEFKRVSLKVPLGGLGVMVRTHSRGIEVTEVLPSGVAGGMLSPGDVITDIGQGKEPMVNVAGFPLAGATALMLGSEKSVVRVRVLVASKPLVYTLKRSTLYEVPETAPLLRVLNSGDEWVAFTPQGYFACSPGGDELMGWRVDQGPNRLAKFFPAEQFRKSLYRPDVIDKLLAEGSLEAALQKASEKEDAPTVQIAQVLPPEVKLIRPTPGATLTDNETVVEVEARPRRKDQPVTQLRLLVDDRAEGSPIETKKMSDGEGPVLHRWKVKLPPGQHNLQVLATSAVSEGRSAEVVVNQKGKELPSTLRVLLVAINNPGANAADMNLRYARKDAERLRESFTAHSGKLFDRVEVAELVDDMATRSNVVQALRKLETRAEAGDVTVVYLACHGLTDSTNDLYFLTHGGKPKTFEDCLEASILMERVQKISGRTVLILDTCKSGAVERLYNGFNRLGTRWKESKSGVALLTACLGDQSALERNDLKPPGSLYTHYLHRGLNGEGKDARGRLTLNSVARYVELETEKSAAKLDRSIPLTSFRLIPTSMYDMILTAPK